MIAACSMAPMHGTGMSTHMQHLPWVVIGRVSCLWYILWLEHIALLQHRHHFGRLECWNM
jgi:hypothetical protein